MSDTDLSADELEKPAFTPEQEQYMSKMFDKQSEQLTSHFGRIVTKQFEEKFMPKIKQDIDPEKLNEQLSNKLFGGDVDGTVREIVSRMDKEKAAAAAEKKNQITKELLKFKDQPFYKETFAEAEKIAQKAMNEKGYPPGPAAEFAFEKSQKNYLLGRDPEFKEKKLGMSGPGKQIPSSKQKSLPADLKKAAQRDIKDGLFKDEAEYINSLSPRLKAKYEL